MKRFYIALGLLTAIIAFSINGHIRILNSFNSIEADLEKCLEAADNEDFKAIEENLAQAEAKWEKTIWLIGSIYSHQTKIEMKHTFLIIRQLMESGDMEHFKEKTTEMISYIKTSNDSIAVKLHNIF